jgi:flagellar basal-body rod protein FlgC
MSMLKIFDVAGSAVSAQAQRLNVVASNLANADTVAGPDGSAYKARQVVFQTALMGTGAGVGIGSRGFGVVGNADAREASAGVAVSTIREDQSPGRRVHDPKHPSADAEGYVTYSNVNPVEEMVNMISASRSYQNNVEVMTTARSLLLKTLQIGQS